MKAREAEVEELKRKVAELEAKLTVVSQRRVGSACLPADGAAGTACPTFDESRIAQITPLMNHTPPATAVASPIQTAPSGKTPDSSPSVLQSTNQTNHEPSSGTSAASRPARRVLTFDDPEAARIHMQIRSL